MGANETNTTPAVAYAAAADSTHVGTDAGGTDAGGTDAGGTDAGGTDAWGRDAGTNAPAAAASTPADSMADPRDELFRNVVAELRKPPSEEGNRRSLLTLSLIAFVAASWLFQDQTILGIAVLVAVLFFHELGHALAMRFLGYRDVRILFLPMFGAVATGQQASGALWKECVVLLAGPLPGLVIGSILALLPATNSIPWVETLATAMIAVNAFNLLPFEPLDGGRLAGILVFGGAPRLRVDCSILTSLAFVYFLQPSLLVGAFVIVAFTLPQLVQRRSARIAVGLRRRLGLGKAALPTNIAGADRDLLYEIFVECEKTPFRGTQPLEARARIRATQVKLVYEMLRVRPVPVLVAAPIGFLYFGLLLLIALSMAQT